MVNQIEAMKQALEALRHASWDNDYEMFAGAEAERKLRAAIKQAEKSNIKQVIHLYDEPPAAPVQKGN